LRQAGIGQIRASPCRTELDLKWSEANRHRRSPAQIAGGWLCDGFGVTILPAFGNYSSCPFANA
jgi:hypothetical protein